ncbi:hypothetical protein [Clostridium sp.]|jgi:hypothetical protein|uniref:hypothetical protein n=1 Tax=Clostridium sp. TaxID=1506 RepID=UPI0025B9D31C|nr:hypothetical protein [Clostridium sp.]MCI9070844.1 hypothetical protein [Clostridium sp.]
MSKLNALEECFKNAIDCGMRYVAIKIETVGCKQPEIIINFRDNFEKKLSYYKKAYDEDLILRSFKGIRIIDFCCANSLDDIEGELILYC